MQLKRPSLSGILLRSSPVRATSFVWILTKKQFLHSKGVVPMVGIEVLSSLVKALTNCSFKISTWSVGSE